MAIKIALAGNPNCGKTTMFNDLTGSNQYVGNWPGVTVEKKEGCLKEAEDVVIQDLPGVYSLSPYTMEEVVTRTDEELFGNTTRAKRYVQDDLQLLRRECSVPADNHSEKRYI